MDNNSRLVYSTDIGRIKEEEQKPTRPAGDGIVRIQRQTSGRKGKGFVLSLVLIWMMPLWLN